MNDFIMIYLLFGCKCMIKINLLKRKIYFLKKSLPVFMDMNGAALVAGNTLRATRSDDFTENLDAFALILPLCMFSILIFFITLRKF